MSVITLEDVEVREAAYLLGEDIDLAKRTNDPALIAEIRVLWDNEPWEDILEKAAVEGSTWYVWWMDGARAYLRKAREEGR